MKRAFVLAALIVCFATWLFARPYSVPCPYDGESMRFTGHMQPLGVNQQSCQYGHEAQVVDADGRGEHQVFHTTWVACDSN